MILYFENGRLGNQIFQYVGIRANYKNQKIILFGFDDLRDMFDGIDGITAFGRMGIARKIIDNILWPPLNYLGMRHHIISISREVEYSTDTEIETRRGIIPWITLFIDRYFQSEKDLDLSIASRLIIKRKFIDSASFIINNIPGLDAQRRKIFVHIRRSDYNDWPSETTSAVLPFSWYEHAMDVMRSKYEHPFFIIVTDDVPYAEENFLGRKDVWISRSDQFVDFALMSLCSDGILSASSFSWWGSYFSRQHSTDGFYIGPQFWVGHRTNTWYPEHIQTEWIHYIPVSR
jgi:hypothetical protein